MLSDNRQTMTRKLTLTILSLTFIFSCDRVMPGGLWDKFETDLRVEKQSDQGPWGGTRSYYWRSETLGHFNKAQIIDFASTNGWTLIESKKYKGEEIRNLKASGKPTFTIQIGPLEPSSDDNFLEQDFPRWTNTDLTLYKFKTGWLIFKPGTDNSTEINGFVLISEDEKEMTVYHLWGE